MLAAAALRCPHGAIRWLSSAAAARRLPPLDEGDWSYYREWWGEDDGPGDGAHTIFRRHSEHGDGVVSVVAYPASRPSVFTDVKSMVSAGLTALPSCSYDLPRAVFGQDTLKILCIGHRGGSLPLFLASKFRGAAIHIVEIDPVVVSASFILWVSPHHL